MPLSHDDGAAIIDNVRIQLLKAYDNDELAVIAGLQWLITIMRLCHIFRLPIADEHFPAILRAYANALELAGKLEKEKK